VLINNGGVSSRSSFLDTKPEVDAMVMQINFLSGASLAKAVVPGMVDRKSGAILWISSVQGLFGLPERTSYAASKFAVQGYCEALRGELASSGVNVHVASPGYIRTNLSRSAITGDGSPYGKLDSTTANGAS
jgi:dehydrogenase/reductase SDR family protein 7B